MADPPINYPKWVTPHASHVTTLIKGGKQIAPLWPQSFVIPGTSTIQVLVNNKDEENKATGASTITIPAQS